MAGSSAHGSKWGTIASFPSASSSSSPAAPGSSPDVAVASPNRKARPGLQSLLQQQPPSPPAAATAAASPRSHQSSSSGALDGPSAWQMASATGAADAGTTMVSHNGSAASGMDNVSVRRNHTISSAGGKIAAKSEQRQREMSMQRLNSHFERPPLPFDQQQQGSDLVRGASEGLREVWNRGNAPAAAGRSSGRQPTTSSRQAPTDPGTLRELHTAASAGAAPKNDKHDQALYDKVTVQRNKSMPNSRTGASTKPEFSSLRHHQLPQLTGAQRDANADDDDDDDSQHQLVAEHNYRYAFFDDEDEQEQMANVVKHHRYSSQPDSRTSGLNGNANGVGPLGASLVSPTGSISSRSRLEHRSVRSPWDSPVTELVGSSGSGVAGGGGPFTGSPRTSALLSPIVPHADDQLPISGLDRGPFGSAGAQRSASPSRHPSNNASPAAIRRHQSLSYRSSHSSLGPGSGRTGTAALPSLVSRFGPADANRPPNPSTGATANDAPGISAGLKQPIRSSTLDIAPPDGIEQYERQRYGKVAAAAGYSNSNCNGNSNSDGPTSSPLPHSPLTPTHTSSSAPWLIDEQPRSASNLRGSPTTRFSPSAGAGAGTGAVKGAASPLNYANASDLASVQRDLANVQLRDGENDRDRSQSHSNQVNNSLPSARPSSQLRKLPSLITDPETLAARASATSSSRPLAGPVSASAYVPPIGHGHSRADSSSSPVVYIPRSEKTALLADGESAAMHRNGGRGTGGAAAAAAGASGGLTGAHARANRVHMRSGGGHQQHGNPLAGPYTALPASQSESFRWPLAPATPTPASGTKAANNAFAEGDVSEFDVSVTPSTLQERTPTGDASFAAQQQLENPAHATGPMDLSSFAQAHPLAAISPCPPLAPLPQRFAAPTIQQPQMQAMLPQMPFGALPGGGGSASLGVPFQPPMGPDPSLDGASHGVGTGHNSSALSNKIPPHLIMEANRLVAERHFNPVDFPYLCPPPGARFFVIKSFTEDDVHKSLKHEIWASTEKGNARLDRAFRETKNLPAAPASVASADGAAGQGPPIYLFYSVNASGHFCGMAEMLSPLDYNTTSNVWAQENKWKGIFKVRWIYVKDLPNNQLRHLRLTNTTEQKPVTQSRDTQELPSNVGQEMLRIMAEFPAKTSLLQDFAFYEMQSHQNEAQKKAATAAAAAAAGSVGQPTGTPGLPHPASGMMSAPPPHVLLPMPTSSPMPFYQQATPFFGSDPAASLRYQQQLQNLFLNRPPQYQTQLPQQPFLQQQRQRGSQPYIPSPQPSPGFPHA